jgi:hypothetical protein
MWKDNSGFDVVAVLAPGVKLPRIEVLSGNLEVR